MKRATYALLVLIVMCGSFLAGVSWNRPAPDPSPGQQQKILYYACPMHPQYHSGGPGTCPSCGMPLVPMYAGGDPGASARGGSDPAVGGVQISAERQQVIGVRLGVAQRVGGTRMVRTTGRVVPNEDALYPLVAGVSGLVREVRSPTAGTMVKRHQVLASFYAPELLGAAQSFLAAVHAQADRDDLQTNGNLQRTSDALRNLGVSETQIEDLRASRRIEPNVTIASPVDGYVLQRNALVGQRVERGTELYRIADLRRVWILADVYDSLQPFIHPGLDALVTTASQHRRFKGKVSAAQPIFDETTRTVKVRLESDNSGLVLKPGMFVDVEFAIDVTPTLIVPVDAIVDTGLRKTVFVNRGNGHFEPRQIETGWRMDGDVEVVKGLMEGERIVVSGTFLIDSETRMRAARLDRGRDPIKDPVCGMDLDPDEASAAGRRVEDRGEAYYFCSDECKRRFLADPAKFALK